MSGRPPEYKDIYPEFILKLSKQGKVNAQLYAALDISRSTFYNWLDSYPEFKDAYERGRAQAESYWANQLQEMTLAREDKGSKACIMILNNNYGWGRDGTSSGTTNNIQIGTMNVTNKSASEITALIENKLEKLGMKMLPVIDIIPIPEEINAPRE